ncbi:hypothetical protein BP5796_07953 [Coleophoma crateriformis]|uniref:Leucine-rich repeat-containing protein 51 n=1 Tax=Coleophoma crateriformis TaxID=565419 RepID=A0A3D8RCZ3_9HELO|nr:hypothetical protein BP5796_07953 [Coleophoma crateriformis]
MANSFHVGQRLSIKHQSCTVRYIGPVQGTKDESEEYLGLEWDDAARGKHDGSHLNKRYFRCQSTSSTAASLISARKVVLDPRQTFVEAVRHKYATNLADPLGPGAAEQKIMISISKVAEEVGFAKINAILAQLNRLRIVIVDGLSIYSADEPGEIKATCPAIVELDMSRNLFEDITPILKICGELEALKILRLNGNRLQIKDNDSSPQFQIGSVNPFNGLVELELNETLLSWVDICKIAQRCPSLTSLKASQNLLACLSSEPLPVVTRTSGFVNNNSNDSREKPSEASTNGLQQSSLVLTLKSMYLELNEFSNLADLAPLVFFKNLRNLHMKGNKISNISSSLPTSTEPIFDTNLRFVDLRNNGISSWDLVDALPRVFPGLTELAISGNPIWKAVREGGILAEEEDGYRLTVARLGNLKRLDFSEVTDVYRKDAEMFYLSQIGRALSKVPESEESMITALHPRYAELCSIYEPPVVFRSNDGSTNPDFLEARLIKLDFYLPPNTIPGQMEETHRLIEVPKAFSIYRAKGIVGKKFGLPTMKIRLVLETGDWQPDPDYHLESDDENRIDQAGAEQPGGDLRGIWNKREVEIEDSTREIGFVVDGLEGTVRVELR